MPVLASALWTSTGNCCRTECKIVLTSHPSRTFMCLASSLEQVAPQDMHCCHFPGNLHENFVIDLVYAPVAAIWNEKIVHAQKFVICSS